MLNQLSDREFLLSSRLIAFGINILAIYLEIMTGGVGLKNHYAFLRNIEARTIFSGELKRLKEHFTTRVL